MATSGYSAHFGKGYLGKGSGGGKPEGEAKPEGEMHQDGGNVDEQIHGHLQSMHKATGHGHSHIQHKPEGHVAHHVSQEGQVSGPEPTEDCPGGMCGGEMQGGM